MELTSSQVADLKARGQRLDVTVHVGKSGLTEGVVEEARAQLEDTDLVKARLLKAARHQAEDRDSLAEDLAEGADAHLVEVRGNTCLLYKP